MEEEEEEDGFLESPLYNVSRGQGFIGTFGASVM